MRKKTIKIPIYFGAIEMVLVHGIQEWKELWGIHNPGGDGSTYDAFVHTVPRLNRAPKYIVAFNGYPSNKVIAHEVVHLVNRIFLDRGVRLDPVNDEPQAYLTGYLVEQIEKFLNHN